MRLSAIAGLGVMVLSLSACGGGGSGGSIASTPQPATSPAPVQSPSPSDGRTPLPPTPATISGTYEAIAARRSFDGLASVSEPALVPKGALTIAVDAATKVYTLTYSGGPYSFEPGRVSAPANWELGYSRTDPLPYGTPQELVDRGDMLAQNVPAGTGANGAVRAQVSWVRLHNVGHTAGRPQHLSGGYWGQFYTENSTGIASPENFKPTQGVMGTMVFGQRTAAADIPASGKARYELESLLRTPAQDEEGNRIELDDGDTVLDIDFGTRALSATYDLSRKYETFETDEEGYPIAGEDGDPILLERIDMQVHASGSTKVANDGSFSLGLSGTGTLRTFSPEESLLADMAKPVSGSIDGAFFGPQAAEVGGIWNLPELATDGTALSASDGFFGLRATP